MKWLLVFGSVIKTISWFTPALGSYNINYVYSGLPTSLHLCASSVSFPACALLSSFSVEPHKYVTKNNSNCTYWRQHCSDSKRKEYLHPEKHNTLMPVKTGGCNTFFLFACLFLISLMWYYSSLKVFIKLKKIKLRVLAQCELQRCCLLGTRCTSEWKVRERIMPLFRAQYGVMEGHSIDQINSLCLIRPCLHYKTLLRKRVAIKFEP